MTAPPAIQFHTAGGDDQSRGDRPSPLVVADSVRPRPRGRMFEDIAELSKSDRRDRSVARSSSGSGAEEETDSPKPRPLLERLNPAVTESEDRRNAMQSPVPGDRYKPCSLPSSPPKSSKGDCEHEPSEGYHSMEWAKGGGGDKPGPHSALLQVSEAHLAILPDEDGDT